MTGIAGLGVTAMTLHLAPAAAAAEVGRPPVASTDSSPEQGEPSVRVMTSTTKRPPIARRPVPKSRAQIHAEEIAAHTATLQQAANAAALAGQRAGFRTGVAVYDLQWGIAVSAGEHSSYFVTESVVKMVLATHLLVHGRMGGVEGMASYMIRSSDNRSANALYGRAGGDGVVPWAGRYFGVPNLGAGPVRPGSWGATRMTPAGTAEFLAKVKNDPKAGAWLYREMSLATRNYWDGTTQWFGLKALDPQAAVKQGTGNDAPGRGVATPSVGYVNNGRFAVAIFSERTPAVSWPSAMAVVSNQARQLGYLMAPAK